MRTPNRWHDHLPRYFAARGADGQALIYRDYGTVAAPVLTRSDLRDDPDLWEAIVALVGVEPETTP